MMLLVSGSACSPACRSRLAQETGEKVNQAESVWQARCMLREGGYNLIVIDQNLMEPDPLALDNMLQEVGGAIPVYVNFAVNNVDRLVREVRIASRRAQYERQAAMCAAAQSLRNELRDAVTGILLSTDLALAESGLPETAAVKIKVVRDLADEMRKHLEITT